MYIYTYRLRYTFEQTLIHMYAAIYFTPYGPGKCLRRKMDNCITSLYRIVNEAQCCFNFKR